VINYNCMLFWYPVIQRAGVLAPKTRIISFDQQLGPLLDGEDVPGASMLFVRIHEEAKSVGGYPVFLRTGHTSGKHEWKDACFLGCAEDIPSHVVKIVEYSAMAHIMGLPTDIWVVREMLQPVTAFMAFHGRMPVSLEFRCFIRGDDFLYMIPYWQEQVIAHSDQWHPPSARNWRELLRDLYNSATMEDERHIIVETRKIGAALARAEGSDEAWSVDWMKCQDGNWYCIDMALAESSWGWRGLESEEKAINP
jgi:hypothetical protein